MTRTSEVECKAGTFCVDGVEQQCPAGSYGTVDSETDPACDGLCDEGFHCPPGSTSATAGTCTAGYYCPAGSSSPTEEQCGDVTVFCQNGLRFVVQDGYVGEGPAATQTGESECGEYGCWPVP